MIINSKVIIYEELIFLYIFFFWVYYMVICIAWFKNIKLYFLDVLYIGKIGKMLIVVEGRLIGICDLLMLFILFLRMFLNIYKRKFKKF